MSETAATVTEPSTNIPSGSGSGRNIMDLLKIQVQVIRALAIRDMQSQQSGLAYGFGWVFFDSFLAFAGLLILRVAIKGFSRPGVPIIMFFVSGLIPWLLFNACFRLPDGAIKRGKNLLALPRVTELDLVLGSAVRVFLIFAVLFLVLAIGDSFYEGVPFPRFPLGLALLFITSAVMGVSFGLMLMILYRLYAPAGKFISFFLRYATILSGVIFDITLLPANILAYLTWNPMLHVEILLRSYWFYSYPPAFASSAYIAECLFGMIFFGLLLERYARRRLPP